MNLLFNAIKYMVLLTIINFSISHLYYSYNYLFNISPLLEGISKRRNELFKEVEYWKKKMDKLDKHESKYYEIMLDYQKKTTNLNHKISGILEAENIILNENKPFWAIIVKPKP